MPEIIYGKKITSASGSAVRPHGYAMYVQQYNETLGLQGRVVRIGAWIGNDSGPGDSTPVVFGIYYQDNMTITAPIAMTYQVNITNDFSSDSEGQNVEIAIDPATVNAVLKSASGYPETYYFDAWAIALIDVTGGAGTTRKTAIATTGSASNNEKRREKEHGVASLPDPLAWDDTVTPNKLLAAYLVIEDNRPPTCEILSPTPGAVLGSLTPTITARFTDPDRTAGYNDYPTSYKVFLYEYSPASNGFLLIRSWQANLSNPGAGTGAVDVNIPWSGAALEYDTTYAVAVQFRDELEETGSDGENFSNTFTVSPAGQVTVTAPLGKIETVAPANFTAVYNNPSGVNADKVEVRLLRRSGAAYTEVDASPLVDIANVAPGGTLSITWAQAAFANLDWSTDYATEWRVTDVAAGVGPWSGRADFHTDYTPSTPTNLSPAGQSFVSPPLLSFDMVDADDAAPPSGDLVAQAEITGPYPVNGTFDVDASGWTAESNAAGVTATQGRTTSSPRTGAGAYQHNISASTNTTVSDTNALVATRVSTDLPVWEGYTYTWEAWTNPATNLKGRLVISWFNASMALISQTLSAVSVGTGWQKLTASGTAPTNARFARIYLWTVQAASSTIGIVKFDDATMAPGVRYVRSPAKATTGNRWEYQALAADVNVTGAYTWRARGYDGLLYGLWSAAGSFNIVVGPGLTITAPTASQVLATNTPVIIWTVDTGSQNRYRVQIFLSDAVTLAYDTGWITGPAVRSHAVPSGWLYENTNYLVQVLAEDAGLLVGGSSLRAFSIDYPVPDPPTNLTATTVHLPLDDEPSAIELHWDPVDTPPDNLIAVEVRRWRQGEPEGAIRVARFMGFDPGIYTDPTPASGPTYVYAVRQSVRTGTDVQDSADAIVNAQIVLTSMILSDADDPNIRVVMRMWSNRRESWKGEQQFHIPAGGLDYVESVGTLRGRDLSIGWRVASSDQMNLPGNISADEYLNRLYVLWNRRRPMLLRLAAGASGSADQGIREYVTFQGDPSVNHINTNAVKYEVTLNLRRIAFVEAVSS